MGLSTKLKSLKIERRSPAMMIAAIGIAGVIAAPVQAASPAWTITSAATPAYFHPGDASGVSAYTVVATNTGGVSTSGDITITDTLPSGLTLDSSHPLNEVSLKVADETGDILYPCAPSTPVSCVVSGTSLPPGGRLIMFVPVDIDPSAPANVTNVVGVSGGGATSAFVTEHTTVSAQDAPYGFQSLDTSITDPNGVAVTQAGSHPYRFHTGFQLNTVFQSFQPVNPPAASTKDVVGKLPVGMVVNPRATAVRCTEAQLRYTGVTAVPHCPAGSAVGVAHVVAGLFGYTNPTFVEALYNMVPPPGAPAEFAFDVPSAGFDIIVHLIGHVDTAGNYALTAEANDVIQFGEISGFSVDLWGDPTDPSHDKRRGECATAPVDLQTHGCPTAPVGTPLLTMPSACSGPLSTQISVDSWEDPGNFISGSSQTEDSYGNPVGVTGCDQLPFAPTITVQPESTVADSPTGLHVDLHVPQNETLEGLATANLKNAVVTLPKGMVVNPSAADGLVGCSPAQIDLHGAGAAQCPDASKIGTVEVDTPLLEHPLPGSVYLAKQDDNPFGSLLALYIGVDDPSTGVVVKLAGKVESDPVTGQLKATFDENPQLPFEDIKLDFFGGPRAPLMTPSVCGTYTTNTDLTPWSAPQAADAFPFDTFQISGGCVSNEAQAPNNPGFEAGAVTPLAGSYSPFVLKLTRENGSQRLGALNVTLPPGMIGRLAGVAECSDAQLAQATGRNRPGEGAVEQSSPSCPDSSRVGSVTTGVGSGSPLYVGGRAYLAGPYQGAPLSIAIVAPAVAGPFDLGNVVVRSALYIDPNTAQVTVKSDPIPTILQGIPLDIRSLAISIDRAQFTLTPTSCEPMTVSAQAISTQNQTAGLSNRFQVGGCQGLAFKPGMAISTQGKTSKANGASLTVKVSQKPGEADIHKVDLTLPTALPARLTTLQKACTEAQFAANPAGCPAGSFIGTAKAVTPILSVPLTGPAILVSHGGAAFPDVVFLLQGNERGGTIRIDLDGRTDIKKGITYSRFETVPDAPITSFETSLPQGPHSVLSANGNLCTSKLAIPTELVGQNGAKVSQTTKVAVTGCPKTKSLTRAQKLALALKACHKKKHGAKRKACERQARKKYGPVKKKGKK